MAQTTQTAPRNLPNASAPAPAGLTDEARRKGAEARRAMIPPEERRLMEISETLRANIKDTKDETARKALRAQLSANERQRKTLAFVRKAAITFAEIKEVAKQIGLLADLNNYNATADQRAKIKSLFSNTLASALAELDKLPPDDDEGETDKVAARRSAIDEMAAMLKS